MFAQDSSVRSHLSLLRSVLVGLADQIPDIETVLASTDQAPLLTAYRAVVRQLGTQQEFDTCEMYWHESLKESVGAIGESVSNRAPEAWRGVYRSEQLDALLAASPERPLPINLLNRLEPATRVDPEFAYSFLGAIAEYRKRDAVAFIEKYPNLGSDGSADPNEVVSRMAPIFDLKEDRRGRKNRVLFIDERAVGPFDLGICMQEGRAGRGSVSYFEFVMLGRSERVSLRSMGPLSHANVGFDRMFPGYGPGYGIFTSPQELSLNVFASLAIFRALVERFSSCVAHLMKH